MYILKDEGLLGTYFKNTKKGQLYEENPTPDHRYWEKKRVHEQWPSSDWTAIGSDKFWDWRLDGSTN